jgi:hypothetical protein
MLLALVILPILTVVFGITALFVNPENEHLNWTKPLLLSLIFLSASGNVLTSIKSQNDASRLEREYQKNLDTLVKENKALRDGVATTPDEIIELLLGYGYAQDRAVAATKQQIAQSKEADLLLSSEIETMSRQAFLQRNRITVQYTRNFVDSSTINATLSELGFTVGARRPESADSGNTIRFGSNVPARDVKLIAYGFIRSGIALSRIEAFPENTPAELNNQVYVVIRQADQETPGLTIARIRNATDFEIIGGSGL